jgi:O-antigen/teichoic acid export membrane protein
VSRIKSSITNTFSHYLRIDARYFFSGGVWLTLIQGITVFGALIVSVILAHLLSEAEFGIYKYLIGLGALLTSFSLTGIGQAVFQAAAKKQNGFYRKATELSLWYSSGILISGIFLALYYYYFGNTTLAIGCILIAIFYPIINTYQQIFSFLQGRHWYKQSTLLQAIKTTVVTVCCVTLVYFDQNILLLLAVYLSTNALCNFLFHIYFSPKDSTVDSDFLNKYLTYAKSLSVQNILASVAFRLDAIVVFQLLGATQLAIYSIAIIIPEHIKGSFKNIITLLVPKYAQHEDLDTIAKSLIRRSLQLMLVFSVITIIYILISPYVYKLLFPKYEEAIILSQLLALSFPAMIALIPVSALQAHTRSNALSKLNTKSSILMIVFTVIFIFLYGIYGAILAKIISRYSNLFLSYYYFYKSY